MKTKKRVLTSQQKLKAYIILNFIYITKDKNRLFLQMEEIKENIEKETLSLENGLDDLRNIITPKQIGKFLIEVEKV